MTFNKILPFTILKLFIILKSVVLESELIKMLAQSESPLAVKAQLMIIIITITLQ